MAVSQGRRPPSPKATHPQPESYIPHDQKEAAMDTGQANIHYNLSVFRLPTEPINQLTLFSF